MGRVVLPREEFVVPAHPETLHGRIRVDHWVVDALQGGRGAWEGDPRLALYCNAAEQTWELWRLEHNGEYTCCGRSLRPGPGQRGQTLGEDLLNTLLSHLVSIDLRRGQDPIGEWKAHEDALESAQDAELMDWAVNDFGDRFKHALRKDGAFDHVTGV